MKTILALFSMVSLGAILLIGSSTPKSQAAPTSLPSVTISGVTATSPVLQSSGGVVVSATITPTYDSNSGPTTVTGNCQGKSRTNTTTTVAISGQTLTVTTSDPFNSSSGSFAGGAYSVTLPQPTSLIDGIEILNVTASVSEVVTTTVDTTTLTYPSAPCSGTPTISVTQTITSVTKTASGGGSTKYVLDINAPTLTLLPLQSQPTVTQGSNKNIHNVLIGGSELTSYSLTDTVTAPDSSTYSAGDTDTFGQSPHNDGIASDKHDLVGVFIPCTAPVGTYTATAVASTNDLGGNPFGPINSVDVVGPPAGAASDTFVVTPGISLSDQTQIVSELRPSGDYAPMSCFTSHLSTRKVTTLPGSVHVTATVNTTGPCSGFAQISGTVITLSVPAGFSFDKTGGSPAAHVFIGPAAGGFDFHNPSTLAEVTGLIPKPVALGGVVTVDLSNLDLGFGPGVIPANDTIYVRAHAVFSGNSVPSDGTQYVFITSATSTLPGIGPVTNASMGTLTASSACLNGN